jgi:hypothetical protein
LLIGALFCAAMIGVERAAARRQGVQAIGPLLGLTLVATASPFLSTVLSFVVANQLLAGFDPTDVHFIGCSLATVTLACLLGGLFGRRGRPTYWICSGGALVGAASGLIFLFVRPDVRDEWNDFYGSALMLLGLGTLAVMAARGRAGKVSEVPVDPLPEDAAKTSGDASIVPSSLPE